MDAELERVLLERWHVTPADRLGQGGESEVYALDHERVLRLYKPGMLLPYARRRQAFYARLREEQLPFEVPHVLSVDVLADRCYTIEQRMRGRDFGKVLPLLSGADRLTALTSYLRVAEQIGLICLPDAPFGELLAPAMPLQRPTWSAFVWDRIAETLRASGADLQQDVPALAMVLAGMEQALPQFADMQQRCLVHGDYFPPNVFINEHLHICGVGDFGYTTVIGDPRLDIAGAVIYLELMDGYRSADTACLLADLIERHGPGITDVIQFYRLYYSLYFSGCKTSDPPTYRWCVGNLRTYLAGG